MTMKQYLSLRKGDHVQNMRVNSAKKALFGTYILFTTQPYFQNGGLLGMTENSLVMLKDLKLEENVGGARTYARMTELLETMKKYENVITLRKPCAIPNKN